MHMHQLLLLPILGLEAQTVARNIVKLQPGHHTSQSGPLSGGNVTPHLLIRNGDGVRCGPGVGTCSDGKCCSTAGYCGTTQAHCRSPDCQLDFGHCDAHENPEGPPVEDIPRPHVGAVPYGPHVIRSCTRSSTIALTYDDGPNRYTADLLDLLDRYDAKATFFISGINNSKGPIDHPDLPWASLIQRMQHTGHQIASHTWSHQDLSKVTPDQRRQQMLKNEAALRNVLGRIPTYMRPPYSSCLPETGCLDEMGTMGYHIILYDIDTKDYSHDSPSAIQVSKDTFDAALAPWKASEKSWLVIAHDVHEQTVHNLTEHMLRRMAEYGYKAVTVGECLEDPQEFWYREAGEPLVSSTTVRKSSSPEAHDVPPAGSKPISPDGKCGKDYTCAGSSFGPCCSSSDYCGTSNLHCGFGCQPEAGNCFSLDEPSHNDTDSPIRKPTPRPGSGPNDHPNGDGLPGGGSVRKPVKSEANPAVHAFSAAACLMLFICATAIA
ncbi:chitin deacetylase ARB_04768 [Aspergillus lentulus]|uniref:Chitin deacetylase ARB_04768 n=1 Tax=Aspergillus lentulus TaxID=293939 RepID=A0AAN4PAU7_ASPLE|nr:chitin deacetylase ARB_04768 [Aspergillus lentulus]